MTLYSFFCCSNRIEYFDFNTFTAELKHPANLQAEQAYFYVATAQQYGHRGLSIHPYFQNSGTCIHEFSTMKFWV